MKPEERERIIKALEEILEMADQAFRMDKPVDPHFALGWIKAEAKHVREMLESK